MSCCEKQGAASCCTEKAAPSTGPCCPPDCCAPGAKSTDASKGSCCGPDCCTTDAGSTARPLPTATSTVSDNPDEVRASVETYYGKVLASSADLKTSACCSTSCVTPAIRSALRNVPGPVLDRFYGCGSPLPLGIRGLHVLDIGSGSGRDAYVAAALVGSAGRVTGVDMTDEQLAVARDHADTYCRSTLGYPHTNMVFKKGLIEKLVPDCVEANSVDIAISNCVVNLSPEKERVLRGVFAALKNGGEFYFSDVYSDRRLPDEARHNEVLLGECLGGAMYTADFHKLCHAVGFLDPRVVSVSEIKVNDPAMQTLTGGARFDSITFRLFKLDDLEKTLEDYGQTATYNGTIEGSADKYELDNCHTFPKGEAVKVCGNTASMLGSSWLKAHFTVTARGPHLGACKQGSTCSPLSGGGCC